MSNLLKVILGSVAMLTVSHAAFAEEFAVECRTNALAPAKVFARIDRGHGSMWQDAMVVSAKGKTTHQVTNQNSIMPNEVRFWGNDFDLRIDTFATGRPQFNFPYSSKLMNSAHAQGEIDMDCEFLQF